MKQGGLACLPDKYIIQYIHLLNNRTRRRCTLTSYYSGKVSKQKTRC